MQTHKAAFKSELLCTVGWSVQFFACFYCVSVHTLHLSLLVFIQRSNNYVSKNLFYNLWPSLLSLRCRNTVTYLVTTSGERINFLKNKYIHGPLWFSYGCTFKELKILPLFCAQSSLTSSNTISGYCRCGRFYVLELFV
jgi:hypothetical protein